MAEVNTGIVSGVVVWFSNSTGSWEICGIPGKVGDPGIYTLFREKICDPGEFKLSRDPLKISRYNEASFLSPGTPYEALVPFPPIPVSNIAGSRDPGASLRNPTLHNIYFHE